MNSNSRQCDLRLIDLEMGSLARENQTLLQSYMVALTEVIREHEQNIMSSYKWILYQGYSFAPDTDIILLKKELEHITDTPLNSRSIVIKKDSLEGGNNYWLAHLMRTSDGQQGMSVYGISTATQPTGGTCSITPSSSISLKTNFNLSCSNWKSDSTPLPYKFQYQLENGLHSIIYNGLNSAVISWLSPGNRSENYTVEFVVTVTDKCGASSAAVNLSVQVKPSLLLRPGNITKFLTANNSLFNDVIKDGDLAKQHK